MSEWTLVYDGYRPEQTGLREVLCALGNGYIVSRAAAPDAAADGTHYPGTYLAGGYNRLTTSVEGRAIENEDLVNLPNWLPLAIGIEDDDWLAPARVEYNAYRQELALDRALLSRSLRFVDGSGRVTRWEERRIVSMDDPHLAALSVTVTPENWSGRLRVRSGIDGSVTNAGVARYRMLASRHLETLATGRAEDGSLFLRSRMVQSRQEIALAARTRLRTVAPVTGEPSWRDLDDAVEEEFAITVAAGTEVHVEKVAACFSSKDSAISDPLDEAVSRARAAPGFEVLAARHAAAWARLWEVCDIRIECRSDRAAQLKLRLQVFHLLQTVSHHSVERDVGVPPRGWHGEAYRGHIMWDELFIFPYLDLRLPILTRSLLRYRYRRLAAARAAARAADLEGAMFPWQSGSNGREESQRIHLNPVSGRWIPDNSWRQRHIGAAIVYNVWQYMQATDDRQFLYDYGAELCLEIAKFWSGLATPRADGRFDIAGVMGPDEFHTADPGVAPEAEAGLRNNAYTNLMVAWLLERALDLLDQLPQDLRDHLCRSLELDPHELARWDIISRRLFVPLRDDGIIDQFEGYGVLEELDWNGYRERYDSVQRLDRILESEGRNPNDYKISKQADVLMLFYLFSSEEIGQIFERLGYDFDPDLIFRNIEYYTRRTTHGSTLSWLVHAWVLARCDRPRSWELAQKALDADIGDLQGGTTREGIHLGAMAGTVDLIQRCYTGIEFGRGSLVFNPRLPAEIERLAMVLRYRQHTLDIEVTQDRLTVASRPVTAHPIAIAYRSHSREISPGQSYSFRLLPERQPLSPERQEARARAIEDRWHMLRKECF